CVLRRLTEISISEFIWESLMLDPAIVYKGPVLQSTSVKGRASRVSDFNRNTSLLYMITLQIQAGDEFFFVQISFGVSPHVEM
ncbi:hypothetical protein NDU88_001401, partial [Pleurodeles waltl]